MIVGVIVGMIVGVVVGVRGSVIVGTFLNYITLVGLPLEYTRPREY